MGGTMAAKFPVRALGTAREVRALPGFVFALGILVIAGSVFAADLGRDRDHGNTFNFDYHVSFPEEEEKQVYYNYESQEFISDELPGLSVFYKDENGDVFHTYSTYGRGLDILVGTYNFLDLVPKGRDENPDSTMDWVRRHDEY